MPDKITTEELTELFGERMPIDAVMLLDKWKGDHGELRAILHKRAETWQAHVELETSYDALAQDYHDLYEQMEDQEC